MGLAACFANGFFDLVAEKATRIWNNSFCTGYRRSGATPRPVLALFSFVGFERVTGARAEAHKPLKTIVIQNPMMAGVFFIVCSYAEVMGFHTIGQDLGNNQTPTCVLAIGRRRAAAGVVDRYWRPGQHVRWHLGLCARLRRAS